MTMLLVLTVVFWMTVVLGDSGVGVNGVGVNGVGMTVVLE